jgi:hypothetical protein
MKFERIIMIAAAILDLFFLTKGFSTLPVAKEEYTVDRT